MKSHKYLFLALTPLVLLASCNSKENEEKKEETVKLDLDKYITKLNGNIQLDGKLTLSSSDEKYKDYDGIVAETVFAFTTKDDVSKKDKYYESINFSVLDEEQPCKYIFNENNIAKKEYISLKNEIVSEIVVDTNGTNVSFDKYKNPFLKLEKKDYEEKSLKQFRVNNDVIFSKFIPESMESDLTINSNVFTIRDDNHIRLLVDATYKDNINIKGDYMIDCTIEEAYKLETRVNNESSNTIVQTAFNDLNTKESYSIDVNNSLKISQKSLSVPVIKEFKHTSKYTKDGFATYPGNNSQTIKDIFDSMKTNDDNTSDGSTTDSTDTSSDELQKLLDGVIDVADTGSGIKKYDDNKFYKFNFKEKQDTDSTDQDQTAPVSLADATYKYEATKGEVVEDYATNPIKYIPYVKDVVGSVFNIEEKTIGIKPLTRKVKNCTFDNPNLNNLFINAIGENENSKETFGLLNSAVKIILDENNNIESTNFSSSFTYGDYVLDLVSKITYHFEDTVIDDIEFK